MRTLTSMIIQPALAIAAAAVMLTVLSAGPADAKRKARLQHSERAEAVEVDCTPRNGWGGYYGNPWCRTGPSEAGNRRTYGYPAWVPKKYREW